MKTKTIENNKPKMDREQYIGLSLLFVSTLEGANIEAFVNDDGNKVYNITIDCKPQPKTFVIDSSNPEENYSDLLKSVLILGLEKYIFNPENCNASKEIDLNDENRLLSVASLILNEITYDFTDTNAIIDRIQSYGMEPTKLIDRMSKMKEKRENLINLLDHTIPNTFDSCCLCYALDLHKNIFELDNSNLNELIDINPADIYENLEKTKNSFSRRHEDPVM